MLITTNRRRLILGSSAASLIAACGAPTTSSPDEAPSTGAPETPAQSIIVATSSTQGATLVGKAPAGATVRVMGAATRANALGDFVIGFDRDAPDSVTVTVTATSGEASGHIVAVTPREFPTQTIDQPVARTVDGEEPFPPEWFDLDEEIGASARTFTAEEAAQIARERALKDAAFASEADVSGFAETWTPPVRGRRITSHWGARRILVTPSGRITRTHYGIDVAAPTGTPIAAPSSALVVLAEPDMYFEGGCVFLDHGQGLISIYLHMNSLDVAAGQQVAAGAQIGTVGRKGRATGPHLCWRMKWRDQNLDPTLMVGGETALIAS